MAIWPADQVSRWPLSKILPYKNNPRTHPESQIELLARSMRDDGVTMPILVDEAGVIIAGHGRLLAAQRNGFKHYPVVVAKGWSEEKKNATRLRDNQIGLLSGWDVPLITAEIKNLQMAGYDVPLLGFPETQLRKWDVMLGTAGATDPEEAPAKPKAPYVKPGDIWILGDHRILCGDCTKAEDVATIFGGEKAHLMVTDPPYGVDFKRGKYVAPSKKAKGPDFAPIEGDARGVSSGALVQKMLALWNVDPCVAYLWTHLHNFHGELVAAGFRVQSEIIWSKTPFVLGAADYHWQHENCWYAFRGKGHPWYGGRDKGTVWDIAKPSRMENHPTAKPIECMKRPIENSSKKGDLVYEPFSGSGTTIIAAEMTGRRCVAIEIDESYCEVAIERWKSFSGREAFLDDSGKSSHDVKADRLRASGAQHKKGSARVASVQSRASDNQRSVRESVSETSSRESSRGNPNKAKGHSTLPSEVGDGARMIAHGERVRSHRAHRTSGK